MIIVKKVSVSWKASEAKIFTSDTPFKTKWLILDDETSFKWHGINAYNT